MLDPVSLVLTLRPASTPGCDRNQPLSVGSRRSGAPGLPRQPAEADLLIPEPSVPGAHPVCAELTHGAAWLSGKTAVSQRGERRPQTGRRGRRIASPPTAGTRRPRCRASSRLAQEGSHDGERRMPVLRGKHAGQARGHWSSCKSPLARSATPVATPSGPTSLLAARSRAASSRDEMCVPLRMRERDAAQDSCSSSDSAGRLPVARRANGDKGCPSGVVRTAALA
jgi:hypothetical protein